MARRNNKRGRKRPRLSLALIVPSTQARLRTQARPRSLGL
jgi:hypothetical protein